MAFDPEIHDIHPETGFHIDKRTGHVAGVMPVPVARVHGDTEYPKWVEPHPSHIKHHPVHGTPTAPAFPEMDRGRDGLIKVLAVNADEEARALADPDAREEEEEASHEHEGEGDAEHGI